MVDIVKKKFGEQIKFIRKAKSLTQEQLAEFIGINPRQMARIEAGESFVTAETISKLCFSLKIAPKMLFDFELDENKTISKNFELVVRKLYNISNDIPKLDYISIAIDSISNKSALNKLKLMIKGIELITP